MDWANIIGGIAAALVMAVGLPLALRKRKKTGPQKVEQFLEYLEKTGVKASLVEGDVGEAKVGVGRGSGQRVEGVIEIKDRNIDYINVASVTSQYGVNYFLDFLVKSSGLPSQTKRKKTRMAKKKSSAIRGKTVDIEWKGDDYLSKQLNFDYELKDRLLLAELDELKGTIEIYPEPKHEYARIRIPYLLLSREMFEAMDVIAKHVKWGW